MLLRIQSIALSAQEEDVFEDHLLLPRRKDVEDWTRTVCPEALETLSGIVERCDWELELGSWVFPEPPVPEGADRETLLRGHIENGYTRRDIAKTPEITERVETELETIIGRGYTDYFLSVIDIIQHMHQNGILTSTRSVISGVLAMSRRVYPFSI